MLEITKNNGKIEIKREAVKNEVQIPGTVDRSQLNSILVLQIDDIVRDANISVDIYNPLEGEDFEEAKKDFGKPIVKIKIYRKYDSEQSRYHFSKVESIKFESEKQGTDDVITTALDPVVIESVDLSGFQDISYAQMYECVSSIKSSLCKHIDKVNESEKFDYKLIIK
jgi:uncharacterized protein YqkB